MLLQMLLRVDDALELLDVCIELRSRRRLLGLLDLQLLELLKTILDKFLFSGADQPLDLQLINLHP